MFSFHPDLFFFRFGPLSFFDVEIVQCYSFLSIFAFDNLSTFFSKTEDHDFSMCMYIFTVLKRKFLHSAKQVLFLKAVR